MIPRDSLLFPDLDASDELASRIRRFPTTRYQGSKRKLAGWILEQLADVDYHTVLDAFSGTAAVGYAFKCAGKAVTCNDSLRCNHLIASALVANDRRQLPEDTARDLGEPVSGRAYGDLIARTFSGIYYTDEENEWLDRACGNLAHFADPPVRDLAFFALFQSCLAKRPYNLFHRRNLYMRTANVERSFGNKVTWERPFEELMARFARQANAALIDTGVACKAVCGDAAAVEGDFDMVYIDPPYLSEKGVGVDYLGFYHFLEGMTGYDEWEPLIDRTTKHLRLRGESSPWTDPDRIHDAFAAVFDRFRDSHLVVSYRTHGIPTIDELEKLLRQFKRSVRVAAYGKYQYALSTKRENEEVVLVGGSF